MAHGVTDALGEIRRRLREERFRLFRTVVATDEELATLEAHQPGGPPEDVSTELASFLLSRLEGRQRHELDEIDAAQARLEAGTYGTCERCATAIPLARLLAMPTARCCLACQRQHEHQE
jgi:RNA polymerase-binding protein DksA